MSNKISNDENIRNLKKRKILRWIIIVFSIVTIVLSLLSLIVQLNFIFPLITFIITSILMRVRDNTPINKKDDLADVRKIVNKSKK